MNEINMDLLKHECDFVLESIDDDPETARCKFCGKFITDGVVLPHPEEIKPLQFSKYNSIVNSYMADAIDNIKMEALDAYTWVATNKYHGTNFSVMCSAEEQIPCKRSGIIDDGEGFYNYQAMFSYLKKILIEMQSYFGKNIQVYFELFGGSYPHPDVPKDLNATRIQKEVYYCPFIDIRVLDISVDGKFLDYDEMVKIVIQHGLLPAKELARGSFDDLIKMNPEFEDETYLDYNLPKIENNFSEGYVLRPIQELSNKWGERVILKHKSDKFLEKKSEPKEKKALVRKINRKAVLEAYEALSACVTEARLNNVISHGGVYSSKDFGKLMSEVIQDIMKEEADNNKVYQSLEKNERKTVNKAIQKEVAELIKPTFLSIIRR